MKLSYNREDDVLMIETAKGKIDHAVESWPMILHLDKEGKPILVEILRASEFMAQATKTRKGNAAAVRERRAHSGYCGRIV